jgi:CRISPR/Cas system CSM-associated protein Csm3 (group 7 of RAMP superfamily)
LAEPYCLACRIFGSAWRESAVSFGNFYLINNDGSAEESFAERTSVSLNRRLNTAEAGRLLVMQTTAPGAALTFTGLVEGRLKREELAWLLAAFRLVTHLGGSKARGLGRIALKVTELQRWDTSTQPPQWIMVEARSIMEEVLKDAPL